MAKTRKRERKRVAKEERQNLRLWAQGAREEVLTPHIEPYTDALERGWREERTYLQTVCNEFHARFNWRLGEYEEPEAVPDYEPRAPVPEEQLDEEETKAKRARIGELNAVSGG
jgi:hypothetical protein